MSKKKLKLPDRLDDTDILHAYEVTPDHPAWRELTLDLGVPLEPQWTLTVGVSYGRDTEEPLQYTVIEGVNVITRSAFLSAEYNAEIESGRPLFVDRYRSFYFDHRPTRDEVPQLSPIIPKIPCVETRNKRIVRWQPGDPDPGTIAFYCTGSTFEEVLRSLAVLHHGYVRGRYWASGKNPPGRRKRGSKFSKEEYRVRFMSVLKELARSNYQMTPNTMAAFTDILDMKTYKSYMKRDPSLWSDGCELHAKLCLNSRNDE